MRTVFKKMRTLPWVRILVPGPFWLAERFFAYINVGDECWRRNLLVTRKRCWWRFWLRWSPTYTIFLHYLFTLSFCKLASGTNIRKMSTMSKFSRQHPQIVTNSKSPTSGCHQHQDVTNITVTRFLKIFEVVLEGDIGLTIWLLEMNIT